MGVVRNVFVPVAVPVPVAMGGAYYGDNRCCSSTGLHVGGGFSITWGHHRNPPPPCVAVVLGQPLTPEQMQAYLQSQQAYGRQAMNTQPAGDPWEQTVSALNRYEPVTGLEFKHEKKGFWGHDKDKDGYEAKTKKEFTKAYNDNPDFHALADQILGEFNGKLAITLDHKAIALTAPMTPDELKKYGEYENIIGALNKGDIGTAQSLYDAKLKAEQAERDRLAAEEAEKQRKAAEAAAAAAAAKNTPPATAAGPATPAPAAAPTPCATIDFNSLSLRDREAIAQIALETLRDKNIKLVDGQTITHSVNARGKGFDGLSGVDSNEALREFKRHNDLDKNPNSLLDKDTFDRIMLRYQQSVHVQDANGKDDVTGKLDRATLTNIMAQEDILHSKPNGVAHTYNLERVLNKLPVSEATGVMPPKPTPAGAPTPVKHQMSYLS